MRAPPRRDVLPILFLAAALASVAVATYLEGKRLWAAYNVVGLTLLLAFALLVARLRLDLPRGATLVCYLTLILHYVGGSLGGHFGIDGVNGLYAVFPWWDRVTHFAGASGVALLAFHVLRGVGARDAWRVPDGALALFAFALTMAVGVGVELFEFGAWTFFATIDQGFYSNTMMDLYGDATGAAFGAALGVAWARVATSRELSRGAGA